MAFIGDDQLAAIADFMDRGGGVLAAGDHAGVGSLMCGKILRVRSMRRWFAQQDTDGSIPAKAPRNWSALGTDRADTLQPDTAGHWWFDNQSDGVPQPLTLVVPDHPIFQGPHGPINSFPDHMHEGEVMVPWALDESLTFAGRTHKEYPALGGHQEVPEILATGRVIGGHVTSVGDGSPCENRHFASADVPTAGRPLNILCAYDGHNVGVGRVVTDSSFHHYIDLNLTGDPCGNGAKSAGFLSNRDVLDAMSTFFVNLVGWLAPQKQSCASLAFDVQSVDDEITSMLDGFNNGDAPVPRTPHNVAVYLAQLRALQAERADLSARQKAQGCA
ncbi:MAG: hypothetical protein ACYDH6_24655 [Acidimicrobiales bacterium]